jgi:hypothetical protein
MDSDVILNYWCTTTGAKLLMHSVSHLANYDIGPGEAVKLTNCGKRGVVD